MFLLTYISVSANTCAHYYYCKCKTRCFWRSYKYRDRVWLVLFKETPIH